ncbi:SHOCT domain-containing protein [Streptomyces sp. AcE210]|nr:SHOCT domain-containing protein [Streptomyces sp. AcE210]
MGLADHRPNAVQRNGTWGRIMIEVSGRCGQLEFEKLRTSLDTAIAAHHNPQVAPTAPASLADELGKLARLRDQGILDPAEFDTQKAKLLGL